MTGKLPININHLLRQRTIEGGTGRVQGGLESAEGAAHHLRFRQRFPQPRRRLHRSGRRGKRRPPYLAAQGHPSEFHRRDPQGTAESGQFGHPALLSPAHGDLRNRRSDYPRPLGAWRRNPVLTSPK